MPGLPDVYMRFTYMCWLASGLKRLSIAVCTDVPLYVWWYMFTNLIHRLTTAEANISMPPFAWVHKTISISDGVARRRALCRTSLFPALSTKTTSYFPIASKVSASCWIYSLLSSRQSLDECRSRSRQASCLCLAIKYRCFCGNPVLKETRHTVRKILAMSITRSSPSTSCRRQGRLPVSLRILFGL